MGFEQDPTKQAGNRRRQARDPDMLDLNVLPQRYRRPRLRWAAVAPWLSFLGLLVVAYPIFQWFLSANGVFNAVAGDLVHQQATQSALAAPSGTEAALSAQIASANDQTEQLRSAARSVDIQQIAWGSTILFALDQAPTGAVISAVDQNETTLILTGGASTYLVPLEFARRLRGSGRFVSVQVAVIRRNPDLTPVPASGGAASPAASATPASSPFTFRMTLVTASSNMPTLIPEATRAP